MMILTQIPYMIVWMTVLPKVLCLDGVGLGWVGVVVGFCKHIKYHFKYCSHHYFDLRVFFTYLFASYIQ